MPSARGAASIECSMGLLLHGSLLWRTLSGPLDSRYGSATPSPAVGKQSRRGARSRHRPTAAVPPTAHARLVRPSERLLVSSQREYGVWWLGPATAAEPTVPCGRPLETEVRHSQSAPERQRSTSPVTRRGMLRVTARRPAADVHWKLTRGRCPNDCSRLRRARADDPQRKSNCQTAPPESSRPTST